MAGDEIWHGEVFGVGLSYAMSKIPFQSGHFSPSYLAVSFIPNKHIFSYLGSLIPSLYSCPGTLVPCHYSYLSTPVPCHYPIGSTAHSSNIHLTRNHRLKIVLRCSFHMQGTSACKVVVGQLFMNLFS